MSKKESRLSKTSILVVEDSERLRALISIILKVKGYEVRGVANGREALDAVAAEKPHLVLLDVMMPVLNGFEVCRHIKSDPSTKNIPVVMLTAKVSPADIARGEKVGADCYITKPFKSARVMETIQRVLASRQPQNSMPQSQQGLLAGAAREPSRRAS